MSEELDSVLIYKSNGLDTGLKPNLGLKADKYESVTPVNFLATVEITLPKEVFQRCCSHPNKKRDIRETLQNLEKETLSAYLPARKNQPASSQSPTTNDGLSPTS